MSDKADTTIMNVLPESVIPRFMPTFRLQWEEAQDCHVVLYPEGMVKLNQSAGEILKRCDGKTSLGEIADELASRYSCDRGQMVQDTSSFINHAIGRGWLGV